MEKEEKLKMIKKIGPVFYTVGIALLCFYVFCRGRDFLNLLTERETGYVLFPLFVLFLLTMSGFSKRYLVGKNRYTTYFAGIMSFLMLYLMLAVLCCDGIRFLLLGICGFEIDPGKMGLLLGFGGLTAVFISLVYGIHHAGVIRVKRYPIRVENGGRAYRMVLLSDFHIGYYVGETHMRNVVRAVNRLHPDLVLIAGDLINAGNTEECPALEKVEEVLSELQAKEGVLAVTGNHDPKRTDPAFREFLKKSGIRLLEDEAVETDGGTIIGRNTRTEKRKPLSELTEGVLKRPFIVLDHDPLGIKEAREEGMDYVLSGHTHKGQIFPLNLFLRALYRKEEIWGFSKQGKTNLVVTAGSGYFSMPMRIGTDSEVVLLEQEEKAGKKITIGIDNPDRKGIIDKKRETTGGNRSETMYGF